MLLPKSFEYDFVVDSEEITQLEEFKIVSNVLSELCKSGALLLGKGYCISISQMISDALKHQGIKSELIECKMAITYTDKQKISFIGYDNMANPGEMDTHVVVVTKTKIPMLIDGSVAHKLPGDYLAIVAKFINSKDCAIIDRSDLNLMITYSIKENQKVPVAHQMSIVDRIETDKKIFKNLWFLKILVVIAITISTANAIRGLYDFYLVYIEENQWGPRTMQELNDRVKNIEEKIK